MSLVPSPLARLASATLSGIVSTVAQSFAGAKTFLGALVASAGLQLTTANQLLRVTPPTTVSAQSFAAPAMWFETTAAGQTNMLQIGSGLGSTQWEFALGYFTGGLQPIIQTRASSIYFSMPTGTGLIAGGATFGNDLGNSNNYWRDAYLGGVVRQLGTDSSGTPGAATINKPSGISAIASGATTCVITNSLAATTSRIIVTWHGDHGAARWWVVRAAGSFTVTLSAAAGANTTFSWELAAIF